MQAERVSSQAVCEAILKGIELGELVPGQRLEEKEFSKRFGAAPSVIRSAFQELVLHGLLEHRERRGLRVRPISLQEALQISEVRLVLESLCAAKAAENITDAEIDALRALIKEMQKLAELGDTVGYSDLVNKVFTTYVRIADQPVAEEVLMGLRDRNSQHRFRLSYRPNRARVSLPYWIDLIEAICERDPDAARLAVERRTQNAQEAMKALRSSGNFAFFHRLQTDSEDPQGEA